MKAPTAQLAIDILKPLVAELGPAQAAFWVTPTMVLTLSGARGIADGVFYTNDVTLQAKWQQELRAALKIFDKTRPEPMIVVGSHTNPMGRVYVSYDVLFVPGLEYALHQTKLLSDADKIKLLHGPIDNESLGVMTKLLKHHPDTKEFDEEFLGHVATGILLGYPDQAIVGALKARLQGASFVPFAHIKYADFYHCPQPIYERPDDLKNNVSIKKHEQDWSKLLKDFYTSDFHKDLAKDPAFMEKAKQIGLTT
ncbi:MAG TPA: hypothetical protein VK694_01875 [Verrucomicrobiae bacterium]|nr:hypothetical protein [Verrucomicrobiae bacterium]